MIERRAGLPRLAPRIYKPRPVRVAGRELPTLPKGRLEVRVQDLQQASVDPSEDVFLAPLETESMKTGCVRGVQSLLFPVGLVPGIGIWGRTPVERGGYNVVAAKRVGVVVASGFGDVDLAGCRPWAICVVHGQKPDSGPEPVAAGKLSNDLDPAESNRGTFLGIDATGKNRRDNRAVGKICSCDAGGEDRGSATGSEIDCLIVCENQTCVLESGLDIQRKRRSVDEDVRLRRGRLLEFAIPRP